jgi:multimeric flavodoxin WrbA
MEQNGRLSFAALWPQSIIGEKTSMQEKQIKVVAMNGSARKSGNTAILLGYVLKELENEGIATELIELSGKTIHGCRACGKCSAKKDGHCSQAGDDGNALIDKMVEADGILLGSPTYFSNISPEIAALMDRACFVARANGGLFRRKVGAAVVAVRRAGAIPAFDALNHFFFFSQMVVPGSSYWNVGIGREIGDVEKDEEGIQIMKTLGENMAWVLKKINT